MSAPISQHLERSTCSSPARALLEIWHWRRFEYQGLNCNIERRLNPHALLGRCLRPAPPWRVRVQRSICSCLASILDVRIDWCKYRLLQRECHEHCAPMRVRIVAQVAIECIVICPQRLVPIKLLTIVNIQICGWADRVESVNALCAGPSPLRKSPQPAINLDCLRVMLASRPGGSCSWA